MQERNYNSGLTKAELEHGAYYRGICRNAHIARWNGNEDVFYHWRNKFGNKFIETIRHYEDDKIFDVFNAFEKIEVPEEEIPFDLMGGRRLTP